MITYSKISISVFSQFANPKSLIPISNFFSNPTLQHQFSTSLSSQKKDTHYKLTHKDWLSPTEVIKIFESLKDPESVVSVWNQYTKRRDYKPNEPLLTLVINKLAQGKHFEFIDDIMKRLRLERPCRLSSEFFYGVIKVYGNGGFIRKAMDTLLEMQKGFDVWPSVKCFNFVLNLLVTAKVFDVAMEVYVKGPMLGVEIDACCLNILIKGFCKNGDMEGAFRVFDEFPKQRCKPNVRTFSALMYGLCESGRVFEAFGLLDRLEREGIDPDEIMFNILISGLRKERRVEQGMELLEKMKGKGCEPNAGSYQEVLYGLLDVEKFVEAKELVDRMVSNGFTPSFVSYKRLICGLCKDKLVGDVDWALRQMVKQGFVPRMGMWKQIVESAISENLESNSIDLINHTS